MSAFGTLRLGLGWSRGGGASADPTKATDEHLAALGLVYARSGLMHDLYDRPALPGSYRRRTANQIVYEPVTVAGKRYPAPLSEGAATPLVSYSADLTNAAWTKTNMTAELQTGSLESASDANGHTLLTATGANATVTRALTRSSTARQSRIRIWALPGNAGTVNVSHDNGSTSVTVAAGEFEDIVIPEVTSANPTLWIQLSDSGDQARVYDFQHFERSGGTPPPRTVPQGASPVAVGAAALSKTFGVSPSSVDLSFLLPRSDAVAATRFFATIYKDSSNYWALFFASSSANLQLNNRIAASSDIHTGGAIDFNEQVLVRTRHIGTTMSWWFDGVQAADDTTAAAFPGDLTDLYIGFPGATPFGFPLVSLCDNNGQIFGEAGAGFNIEAINRHQAGL